MTEYDYYLEEKHEARVLGDTDFPDFETWAGKSTARESADARWQYHFDNDTQDLY